MSLFNNSITWLDFSEKIAYTDYTIKMDPMATPRPRGRLAMIKNATLKWNKLKNEEKTLKKAMSLLFVAIYPANGYDTYKTYLVILIQKIRPKIERFEYRGLVVTFYMPYPKSTAKKNLIEGSFHRKKPDWDNLIKGFQDALGDSGIIPNDGMICQAYVEKRYTTNSMGRIEFSLIK